MKLVCGVGFNDGKYPTKINKIRLPQYARWRSMLYRCYTDNRNITNQSYERCVVSDNFKSYSYFYEWYGKNNVCGNLDVNVDKDLLIKNNKIYSEDTCLILPTEINNTFNRQCSARGEYLIGVCFSERKMKYAAYVRIDKKNKTIGYFNSEIEAFIAYKTEKEKYIKFLANKYRDSITEKAYKALMSYRVEITD